MTIAEHLVAHVRGRAPSLRRYDLASWLWARLRAGFPDAFSCVLMDDHIHLVAMPGGVRRFRAILSAFTARTGIRFDVLPPERANSRPIARRMVRYGLLNPVRAELVDDPWVWAWSTLRDLAGVVADPWTPRRSIAWRLRIRPSKLIDAVTHTADSEPPEPRPPVTGFASLDAIFTAVAAALRLPPARVPSSRRGRRLVVQAAYAVGAPRASDLASALRVSDRTVRSLRTPADPGLEAVLRCLADPRLTRT